MVTILEIIVMWNRDRFDGPKPNIDSATAEVSFVEGRQFEQSIKSPEPDKTNRLYFSEPTLLLRRDYLQSLLARNLLSLKAIYTFGQHYCPSPTLRVSQLI